ncbi:hypothetical protein V6N12_042213 [Hibiscus sabdariffa]|uniref:Uncharacterized protein n=1 Tax=Hibiscus sabdariffa TaxID=183260 RepID=A0ABR2EE40_9ROSI
MGPFCQKCELDLFSPNVVFQAWEFDDIVVFSHDHKSRSFDFPIIHPTGQNHSPASRKIYLNKIHYLASAVQNPLFLYKDPYSAISSSLNHGSRGADELIKSVMHQL